MKDCREDCGRVQITMDYRRQANPYLTQTMDTVLTIKGVVGKGKAALKIWNFLKNGDIWPAITELVKGLGEIGASWYNTK